MSFTHIKNHSGPKIEPCGNPTFIFPYSELNVYTYEFFKVTL